MYWLGARIPAQGRSNFGGMTRPIVKYIDTQPLASAIYRCSSITNTHLQFRLSFNRQHLSYGDCLDAKRLSELLCAVLCTTVVYSGMHTKVLKFMFS